MRILLLTQLFHPEPNYLKGLEFARALQADGHAVQVLCTYPNYPGGRIYAGYRLRPWQRETIEGIEIIRVAHYPSHDRSGLKRAASFVSAALAMAVLGPWLVRPVDVVHVYQGPATLAFPAWCLCRRFGCGYVLDVQDIWPESVLDSGMMRFRGAARLLQWWCDRAYQRARRIVVLSPGYRTAIEGRGIAPGKMRVVYNWTDRSFEEPMPEAPEASPGRENSTFTLMYAGNLGPMQSLGTVIEAARLLQVRHPCVRIQLVGDGIEAVALRQQAQALAVSNVEFLGRRPVAEVRRLLAGADASLIHLKDSVLTRMGIPSKTQASLAVGRPVIAALRGDARRLVEASGGGLVCDPEDPDGLAGAVGRLAEMPLAERQAWGGRARAFYLRELAFAVGVRRMMAVLEEARAASDRS